MLHVRDCPGTTTSFDVCPFPWCRKVKHLLFHLISCLDPNTCAICSNVNLNRNMRRLQGLNSYRGEMYQQSLLTNIRARTDVEKETLEAAGQAETKVDNTVLTSDSDSFEVMLLDELMKDNIASNIDDTKMNSTTENLVSDIQFVNDAEVPTPIKGIDFSIHPPVDVPVPVNSTTESKLHLPETSYLPFVAIKLEMDVVGSPSIDACNSTEHLSRSIMDEVIDSKIPADEAMILPTTGSDQTFVHRNNATAAIDENVDVESSSRCTTGLHRKNIKPE